MYAPKLYDLEVGRDTIQEFKGYNHNLRIGDNEFYDMKNLTGKYYPLLSPRGKRGVDDHRFIYGICGKDKLVTIEDFGKDTMWVCYDGKRVFELEPYKEIDRQLISMGAYVIIFPDMMYLNTADLDDHGSCFGDNISFSDDTTYTLFAEDGTPLSAMDMIWGEEFYARDEIYIDPTAGGGDATRYKLFGIPLDYSEDHTKYTHGKYQVKYSVSVELNDNAQYEGYPLFDIEMDAENDGCFVVTPEVEDGIAHREYIKSLIEKASDTILGSMTVTATLDNNYTFTKKISLKCRSEDGRTFKKSGIEVGAHRMYYNDGATKSQVCVRAEDTPEATYATPSCWRDEKTRVRIKADTTFVEELKALLDAKEGHLLTVNSGSVNGKPYATDPLTAKYSDGKSMALNSMTIVSGTEVDILGYLDFFNATAAVSGTIDLSVEAIQLAFDYMIESNNRLWACRYGTDYKGDFVNAIYASAYGSFRTFFKFDGGDADSYQETVGSSGAFTGAATLNGNPVFFKENCCHTIYGTYPSTFQLSTEQGTWVASGSHKSISVDEGELFFHGKDGIYAYDGASKQMISTSLGKERYKNAVGGCVDGKYYVSMQDSKNESGLFVFDKSNGMWHKEDSTEARFLAPYNGDLYMVDSSNRLVTLNGSEGVLEDDVEWYAESGKIGFVNPDNMYIGKIQLKLSLPLSSSIKIYVQYDSDGYWEFKGAVEGKSTASFTVPIMPRSCDHFAIRLSGIGDCKIFSMTKTYEAGGEV